MRKVSIYLILLLLISTLNAKKLTELTELIKPGMIAVSGEKLFITDRSTIYIYSLKNYHLAKKFGREGEGPEEFKINKFASLGMLISTQSNQLVISSESKISYFTLNGKFIKEIKAPPFSLFFPLSSGFVGGSIVQSPKKEMVLGINLYDQKFNKLKILYFSSTKVLPGTTFNFPQDPLLFVVYKDMIFVVTGNQKFIIDVFNKQGDKLYKISKEEPSLRVTMDYKERVKKWLKEKSPYRQFTREVKATFNSHFPVIYDIAVSNNKLYAFTYNKKKHHRECIIMDVKGKELKRVFLSILKDNPTTPSLLYSFSGNYLYFLTENEDKETWELHREKIF